MHPTRDHPETALTPTTLTPRADLQPITPSDSMVWVPGGPGGFTAVPRSTLPADYFHTPAPAALAPALPVRHGIDPRAQILAAGGIGAGAAGWGAGQLVSAVAGLGTAGLLALALLAVAARMSRPGSIAGQGNTGHGSGDRTEIHIHKGGKVRARNVHIR